MRLLFPLLFLSLVLAGCGGGGGGSLTPTPGSNQPNNPPPPSGNGSSGTVQLGAPAAISVGQGQTVAGIDITVPAPSSSPAPNAQNLGVNDLTGRASASNTGGVMSRGSSKRILLFGPGLTGSMQVRISGPGDITVSNQAGVQATDNTPGIAFTVTATPGAALGARTVYLQNASGDVTAFTGGLEIVQ